MDKFKKELAKTKNPWIKKIGKYLLSRDDLKMNLAKEQKSLDECFEYVLGEIAKKCIKKGSVGFAAGDDQKLFDLAVHYYDEDDIKVSKLSFRSNANGTATKKDMESIVENEATTKKDKAKAEIKEEKSVEPKKKIVRKKKANENQMSLDDFLDFGA